MAEIWYNYAYSLFSNGHNSFPIAKIIKIKGIVHRTLNTHSVLEIRLLHFCLTMASYENSMIPY